MYPAQAIPAASGHLGTLAPVAPILKEAERRFGADGIAQIRILNPSGENSVFVITSGNAHHISDSTHVLRVDGTTGNILTDYTEERPVISAFSFLYGLHIARFSSPLIRWLYFLSGTLLVVTIGTGMTLWAQRPGRAAFVVRNMARLNLGLLTGTPLAFSCFLIAARCLPVMMEHRTSGELAITFVVWGFAMILPFIIRNQNRSHQILCLLAAVSFLMLCAFSAPWNTPVRVGMTVTALVLSIGFLRAISFSSRLS